MNLKLNILMLLCFFLLPCFGCRAQIAEDDRLNGNCIPIPHDATFWMETENQFYTNDLSRAQGRISFAIIIPGYIPGEPYTKLPIIEGPLTSDNKTDVRLDYVVHFGSDVTGFIYITERNYPTSQGEFNPNLSVVHIANKRVVKSEFEDSMQKGTWFSFDSKGIYFLVEIYNLPSDEAEKIVESIIKQSEQEQIQGY